MFLATFLYLAGLITLSAAQLPGCGASLPATLIINVVQLGTGAVLGTLNGYGNFSSPGPSYPFRAYPTTQGFATLRAYNLVPCTAQGVLACGGYVPGPAASFYQGCGNIGLEGVNLDWSVDALNDDLGGLDQYGRKFGIPVHVGPSAAIQVALTFKSASG